MLAGLISVTG